MGKPIDCICGLQRVAMRVRTCLCAMYMPMCSVCDKYGHMCNVYAIYNYTCLCARYELGRYFFFLGRLNTLQYKIQYCEYCE